MNAKNELTIFEPFEGKKVRKVFYQNEWYFSVVDIVAVLTDSKNPRNYWSMLKKRESQLYTICVQLKLEGAGTDGKKYKTDCVAFEGFLRLVQSIPSPKAEPLKLQIAKWARQKLEEIVDPSLAVDRARENFLKQGKSPEWVGIRLTGINDRHKLTDEWQARGASTSYDYMLLSKTVHVGTFNISPSEHKLKKGIKAKGAQIRNHMDNGELLAINASEIAVRDLHNRNASQGLDALKRDCEHGSGFGQKVHELYIQTMESGSRLEGSD